MTLANSLKTPTIRTAPVELEAAGEKVAVTVRYKSLSVSDVRAQREMFKQRETANETVYLSETLAGRVTQLIEADGTVISVDADLLENMSVDNLSAIQKAIEADADPK